MSDTETQEVEIADLPESSDEVFEVKKPSEPLKEKPKKKRQMTEEARKRMLQNLEAGRKKSLANRQKRKMLKEHEKNQKQKKLDEEFETKIKKKQEKKVDKTPIEVVINEAPQVKPEPKKKTKSEDNELFAQLKAMRNELNELKAQNRRKSLPVSVKPQPPSVPKNVAIPVVPEITRYIGEAFTSPW